MAHLGKARLLNGLVIMLQDYTVVERLLFFPSLERKKGIIRMSMPIRLALIELCLALMNAFLAIYEDELTEKEI